MYRPDSYLYEEDAIQPEFDHEPMELEATREDYNLAMQSADKFIMNKIGLRWDDLPDNISLWSYLQANMSRAELAHAGREAARERIRESGYEV